MRWSNEHRRRCVIWLQWFDGYVFSGKCPDDEKPRFQCCGEETLGHLGRGIVIEGGGVDVDDLAIILGLDVTADREVDVVGGIYGDEKLVGLLIEWGFCPVPGHLDECFFHVIVSPHGDQMRER